MSKDSIIKGSTGDEANHGGNDSNEVQDPKRRDFLVTATGIATGVGVGAAAIPFIESMKPSADVMSKATAEIDLAGIGKGETRTAEWQGKPIFILHRTEDQIRAMQDSSDTKDPQKDEDRVSNPDWLVVVGLCTHLGCIPNRAADGWFCPCHGSSYDDSGRILEGPAPKNLEVPRYQFISSEKILIG